VSTGVCECGNLGVHSACTPVPPLAQDDAQMICNHAADARVGSVPNSAFCQCNRTSHGVIRDGTN